MRGGTEPKCATIRDMAELIEMRDGSTTSDPRLGRLKQFDERSRNFAYRDADPRLAAYTKVWEVGSALDQGQEGTCVGHGCAHECNATPVPMFQPLDHPKARWWFRESALIDPWPGEEEANGTSVLAGLKTGQKYGYWDAYRWCFNVEEIKAAVSNEGPVIMGTAWLTGMYEPDITGRLYVSGSELGGHCWLIYGFVMKGHINPLTGVLAAEDVFLMQNSWGKGWGKAGRAWMTAVDVARLMQMQGECAVPVGRKDPTAPPLAPVEPAKPTPVEPAKPAPKKRWKRVWDRVWKRWRWVFG